MNEYRYVACALLAALGLLFFAGVRRVFAKPPPGHRYLASSAFGLALVCELAQIACVGVAPGRMLALVPLLATSAGMFVWAALTVRHRPPSLALSPSTPQWLETTGPFGIVRHPFYTSYLLALAAGWLASSAWWIGLPCLLAGTVYWRAARGEERSFALGALAAEYRAYARRVGMFVPRVPHANPTEHRYQTATAAVIACSLPATIDGNVGKAGGASR